LQSWKGLSETLNGDSLQSLPGGTILERIGQVVERKSGDDIRDGAADADIRWRPWPTASMNGLPQLKEELRAQLWLHWRHFCSPLNTGIIVVSNHPNPFCRLKPVSAFNMPGS